MTDSQSEHLSRLRNLLVTALLVGAAGIVLLWVGGVEFPVAVPPGLVILVLGALVVALVRRRWTAWLGCLLGLFVTAGFLLSSPKGFDIIGGSEGTTAAVGQTVEVIGVVVAAALGAVLALRRDRRGAPDDVAATTEDAQPRAR